MSSTDPASPQTPSRRRVYSLGEEIAHSISHGIGVALGIAGLVVLVVLAAVQGSTARVTAFSIYGGTLVFLYLASTLYHSIPHAATKRVMQRIDHAAIYVFIAGSYTPFLILRPEIPARWAVLACIWFVAIGGVVLECALPRSWRKLSVVLYLALGWNAVFTLGKVWSDLPGPGLGLLVGGGVAYTLGVAFYLWRRLPYNHAIWHLFVLGGSVCHFLLFLLFLLPPK